MKTQFGKTIRESNVCVLCGGRRATTKEHIPPRGLFINQPPDYLTVPSCEKCNNSTKLDDDYLRQVMSGASHIGQGIIVWNKKVVPKLKNFPKTQAGLREKIIKTSVNIPPFGVVPFPTIQIDANRIRSSIRKMVFGLYWFHSGNILSQSTCLNVGFISAIDFPSYIKDSKNFDAIKLTRIGIYQNPTVMDTFYYSGAISGLISLWYFVFYKQNAIIASTCEC